MASRIPASWKLRVFKNKDATRGTKIVTVSENSCTTAIYHKKTGFKITKNNETFEIPAEELKVPPTFAKIVNDNFLVCGTPSLSAPPTIMIIELASQSILKTTQLGHIYISEDSKNETIDFVFTKQRERQVHSLKESEFRFLATDTTTRFPMSLDYDRHSNTITALEVSACRLDYKTPISRQKTNFRTQLYFGGIYKLIPALERLSKAEAQVPEIAKRISKISADVMSPGILSTAIPAGLTATFFKATKGLLIDPVPQELANENAHGDISLVGLLAHLRVDNLSAVENFMSQIANSRNLNLARDSREYVLDWLETSVSTTELKRKLSAVTKIPADLLLKLLDSSTRHFNHKQSFLRSKERKISYSPLNAFRIQLECLSELSSQIKKQQYLTSSLITETIESIFRNRYTETKSETALKQRQIYLFLKTFTTDPETDKQCRLAPEQLTKLRNTVALTANESLRYARNREVVSSVRQNIEQQIFAVHFDLNEAELNDLHKTTLTELETCYNLLSSPVEAKKVLLPKTLSKSRRF